ncbi:MAG: sensor histidine kinase, partial [Clostridia bacterium]|nr:sensor histidine kinase [Clostridia bacterium]
AAREALDHYEVCVTDDGPGFDPTNVMDDGENQVGIANVRERLMQVCRGTLILESVPGRGTTAKIRIPKG